MLARLGLSTPITATTPIDERIITTDALFEACTSHWRKMASSSSLFKLEMRDYFRRFGPELSTPLGIGTELAYCVWCSFTVSSRTSSSKRLEINLQGFCRYGTIYRRRNHYPSALAALHLGKGVLLSEIFFFFPYFPNFPYFLDL